jgi:uncharacterized protein YndB with AHSA1/START domain
MLSTRGIRKTILIRASRERVFNSLTRPEDLACWLECVSQPVMTRSHGKDDLWGSHRAAPITIHEYVQDTRVTLCWPVFPVGGTDGEGTSTVASLMLEPFAVATSGQSATLLTVSHQGFPVDGPWDQTFELFDNGWVNGLVYLQLWLERGRSRREANNTDRFTNVTGKTRIAATSEDVFQAFVSPSLLQRWIGGTVEMEASPGGAMSVVWGTGDHAGGEVVLVDEPRHIVWHWWDAQKLAFEDDPGLITIMIWTLTGHVDHTVVSLVDLGYDRSLVDDAYLFDINQGWALMLETLPDVVASQRNRACD